MLTVFNVGQGDAFLLRSDCNCVYNALNPLMVDTGSRAAKVAARVSQGGLTVLLSHSHADHIGGFPQLLSEGKVANIILPCYLPEILSIHRFVRRYTSARFGRINWNKLAQQHVTLAYDGLELCRHIKVLNPPRDPNVFYWDERMASENESADIMMALAGLADRGMELPSDEIIAYESPVVGHNIEGIDEAYRANARKLVHRFFITLNRRLPRVRPDAFRYYVDAHLELAANQASIVFVYSHPVSGRWLFTGDADETVFTRLVARDPGDIAASFLKVPHHGSRENLSWQTLQAVNPKVSIISHGNRRFGCSKDTHPHHEVINLLDRHGGSSYYTNDVIKGGSIIKFQTTGVHEKGLLEFL